MKIKIIGKPHVEIPLTFAQVKHIKSLSHTHYDYYCRSCGEVGGFVYGWFNMYWPHDQCQPETEKPIVMHWREMDTVFKILEFNDDIESATIRNILRVAKMHMEEVAPQWVKEIDV